MIRFNCDYSEGAYASIINRLAETNMEQTPGYGEDIYCKEAEKLIKQRCKNEKIEVHFLVGGTQTNLTVIAAALRPHECALSADTGHIHVHETGAAEACGHKVIGLSSEDGKITAKQAEAFCEAHWTNEAAVHMVKPKLVYLSNPTELGTVYSKAELTALKEVCRRYHLYLYLDGARLSYALSAKGNDVDLPFLAECCDAFYIGGTKTGALFGEALVIRNDLLKEDFRYIIKQKGGMLAKGRLLGIQFIELFRDNLYFELAERADLLALRIKKAFQEKGCSFLTESMTNQQFPIVEDTMLEGLKKKYCYSYERRIDERHSAVRFCTSWATREEDVEALISDIKVL